MRRSTNRKQAPKSPRGSQNSPQKEPLGGSQGFPVRRTSTMKGIGETFGGK